MLKISLCVPVRASVSTRISSRQFPGSSFQLPERFFHIGVVLYSWITRDTFRFQHGGNRFLVWLLQLDFKGKTSDKYGMAQENIDCRSQGHTQLAVKRFTLFFDVAVHTDAKICCACHSINPISHFIALILYDKCNAKSTQQT